MSGIKRKTAWLSGTLLAALMPGWALAEQAGMGLPLALEVRYCECTATDPANARPDVVPGFLEESTLLHADVPRAGSGRLSSGPIALDFEVHDVADSPATYRFSYSASYLSEDEQSTSQAELVLDEGQWIPLFETQHESGPQPQVFSLAVRLVKARGS